MTPLSRPLRTNSPRTLRSRFRPLPAAFYDRPTALVARELLGRQLIRWDGEHLTHGRIVETEAYLATGDPACHAARGRTRRNAAMFGRPGTAYVYAIHARWCFNVVTEPENVPAAVLIRALEPLSGLDRMQARRGVERSLDLTRGPARLCEALAIDRQFDGWDLTVGDALWVADDPAELPDETRIGVTSRIGISSAQELPLRFYVRHVPYVSGPRNRSAP